MSESTPTAAVRPSASDLREIEGVYAAPPFHWVGDGFRVAGYFSAVPDALRKLDPFVLLDYGPRHVFAPTTGRRGVGPHPHRGFETVTIAFEGSVAHRDSTGAGGVIGPGDVQWMTAASGVLHREYHEEGFARRGGPFRMAQLWVNLPRAHKMSPPGYQALEAAAMGVARLPDGAGEVRVVAGEFGGAKGPARTFTPMRLLDARLRAGGRLALDFPARETLALLVMEGEVALNGHAARKGDFVLFRRGAGERVEAVALAEAQLLVLNGEPIGEPVFQYGPFVMNDERGIRQAIEDFQAGKFGVLED